MSVAMIMRWDGFTTEQYDKVRTMVDLDQNFPPGAKLHVVTHDGSALRVTDVWESGEALNTFVNNRLMPAIHSIGVTTQPEVEVYPLHALLSA